MDSNIAEQSDAVLPNDQSCDQVAEHEVTNNPGEDNKSERELNACPRENNNVLPNGKITFNYF